ncbi:MAG: phage tail tube protein [Proteobacteria bacterium]|nr:phage tail tube protein [Pseudomonadota bacterium]
MSRVGGIIFIKVDGGQLRAKGEFEYNIGVAKREAVVGSDGVHGYKEDPQVPFIMGAITDEESLDLKALLSTKDATITLELANNKVIVLKDAWYAEEGTVKTGEGEIPVRFEGLDGDEIR